jgi:hypothetical protein
MGMMMATSPGCSITPFPSTASLQRRVAPGAAVSRLSNTVETCDHASYGDANRSAGSHLEDGS